MVRQRANLKKDIGEHSMNKSAIALSLGLLLGPALAQGTIAQSAQPSVTEQDAHAIGVDAYLYFYPLISMHVTRKQFTNIEPGKEIGKGSMDTFTNVPTDPPADFKGVVRPNFDTLYSIAWLDLTKEPIIVSAPDTGGDIISCRCLTCGPTYLPHPVGEPPERRPATFSSTRPAGAGACL
jgi:hypothetical protein